MPKVEIWPDLLTADDVCERWDIRRRTLSRWLASGYIPGTREPIPHMRIGRKLRFSLDQVRYIETRMSRTTRQRASRKRAS